MAPPGEIISERELNDNTVIISETISDIMENEPLLSRNAQVIGFMSGKGGVGKTGLAINVANFCAVNDVKVLLVDCDVGTNGATMFFSIDGQIKRKLQNYDAVLDFQDILSDLLNEEALGIKSAFGDIHPVTIKQYFDFIPAGIEGNVFDEQELTDDFLQKLEVKLENYFSKWRKEYDLVILDFGAGDGKINYLLAKAADDICIVMQSDEISRQAVRRKLNFLFREHSLDNIMCCINMLPEKASSVFGVIIDEFPGFIQSTDYAELFKQGRMIEISNNALCKKLAEIVNKICRENQAVVMYEFRLEEERLKLLREKEIRLQEEEAENEKHRNRILHIRFIVASAIFVAVLIALALLRIYNVNVAAWQYALGMFCVTAIIWAVIGRGRLYRYLADWLDDLLFWHF